jgi:uroporphyrinogen decarboxylase
MVDRKATMTNRERLEALLRKEKPDRVPILPISLGFSAIYIGKTINEAYTDAQVYINGLRKACNDFDWIFYPLGAPLTTLASEFGGEMKWPSSEYSQAPMVTRFPVDTPEAVFNLKMPDVKTAGTTPKRMEYSRLSSKEKNDNCLFNVMLWLGGPFTSAGNMASVEKMSKWMIKKPEAVHQLMRLSVDYYIELAKYWKDTFGTENVLPFYGEPTAANQIISPKQFEEFVMPYLLELHKAIMGMGYKLIFVHICGEQNANLHLWSQIPCGDPGIVSFGHEVDLEKAAEYFPDDIIMGNLEPAIILTRTADEVYEATAEVIKKGKKLSAAGFIFSPGCELPPASPIENVKAMTKAVNDYGWYD